MASWRRGPCNQDSQDGQDLDRGARSKIIGLENGGAGMVLSPLTCKPQCHLKGIHIHVGKERCSERAQPDHVSAEKRALHLLGPSWPVPEHRAQ